MLDNYKCRRQYENTLKKIRERLEFLCQDGESMDAEIYAGSLSGCYVSIEYHIIINRTHKVKSEHLPISFLTNDWVDIVKIIDDLIAYWREK
jgi:hypothetical protein